jgi:hypothetical protein
MRLITATALLVGLFAGAAIGTAHAGLYTYGSYGFAGTGVTVNDASLGIVNEYGGSGLITLHGSPTLNVYCVDINDELLYSGTFNAGVDPLTDPNLTGTSGITGHSKLADIASLIFNGINPAGVQLAIWEIEYGSAASFILDDPWAQSDAIAYLVDAATIWNVPSNFELFELTAVDGQPNQTMIYLTDPPTGVPEPGTFALLSGAVLMTGLLLKRRRPGRVG